MDSLQQSIRSLAFNTPPEPSNAEITIFSMCAREARRMAEALTIGEQLHLPGGERVDLGRPETASVLELTLRTAARQHLDRGEDPLALIERLGPMLEIARPGGGGAIEVALRVLRAIAMVELLATESRGLFQRPTPLRAQANEALSILAEAYVRRFHDRLPGVFHRAFPNFAEAASRAARPLRRKRGLLLRVLRF